MCSSEYKSSWNEMNDYDDYYNNIDYKSEYGIESTLLSTYELRNIDFIITNCKKEKNETLSLKKFKINKLPEILKEFTWVKKLDVRTCNLLNLDNLPINLEELDASNNKIRCIKKGQLPDSLLIARLNKNLIEKIEELPLKLIGIDLGDNEFKEIDFDFPDTLTILNLSRNRFKNLPKLNYKIEDLDISANYIENIDGLPNSILYLDCSRNELTIIKELPISLKTFSAFGNKIQYVCPLPSNIEDIDLSNNSISWLPQLPESIKKADFSSNKFKNFYISKLPAGLEELNLEKNVNIVIPESLKNDKRVKYLDDEIDIEKLFENETSSYYDSDSARLNNQNKSGTTNYDNDYYKPNYNYRTGYNYGYNNGSNYGSNYGNNYRNNYGDSYNYGTNYGSNYTTGYSYYGTGYNMKTSKYNKSNPHYIIMKKKIEI